MAATRTRTSELLSHRAPKACLPAWIVCDELAIYFRAEVTGPDHFGVVDLRFVVDPFFTESVERAEMNENQMTDTFSVEFRHNWRVDDLTGILYQLDREYIATQD